MPLFEWNDSFSVNVATFNGHHKNLIKMINDLHDAMLKREGAAAMGGVLARLVEYTKYHFTEEEKLMKDLNYPGYAAHRAEHEKFVAKAVDLRDKHKKGEVDLTIETMNFLKDWLKLHIQGTDKKYTGFFNDRKIL